MKRYYLYVVLTRTNTIISRFIRLIKRDMYTHAAISLDEELQYMYSFGRKYTYYPFIGRFKQERLDKGLYKNYDNIPIIIMELEVSKKQYEDAKSLLDHFVANSRSYKYNYMGLLHSLLNRDILYKDRFLCSEFVYYILNESGVADFNIPRNLVRPQSLLNLDSRIIYEGSIGGLKRQSSFYSRMNKLKKRNTLKRINLIVKAAIKGL